MTLSNEKKTKETISPLQAEPQSSSLLSKEPKEPKEDGGFVVLERKSFLFLSVMLALYFILSFSKIHTSSVAIWERVFERPRSETLIFGEPRGIRQDEWMVGTPALIGHYQSGMPLSSPTLGDGNVPAISSLPIKDFTMVFRPHSWPYFVFHDFERAFAFSWNLPIFFFLISSFLLFMVLTKSKFWLSLFGAFLIFLSGGMQWWSYSLGWYMSYLNAGILSLIYLLYERKSPLKIILAALILTVSAYSFVTGLYPAWQVPLAYLYFAMLVGFIMANRDMDSIRQLQWIKIAALVTAGITFSVFIYHFYGLIHETSQLMMNTAYPGKRTALGGDLAAGKLFSEFFGMFMTEGHVPSRWLNISEASGFVMFFPVIFYSMGFSYLKSRTINWLQLVLSAYIVVLLIWILVGYPASVSTLTHFSMSPSYRTLPVLGVANCILLICFLGLRDSERDQAVFSWIEFGIIAVVVFVFIRSVAANINTATNSFFTAEQEFIVVILVESTYLLIRYSHIKDAQPVLALILLGMNISNLTIHPLTLGLSSVLNNPLVTASKEIYEKEPTARWAVFGNHRLTNLLKVNGIDVFNGVKVVPQLKAMRVLDPDGKNDFIYNRYAHIKMFSMVDNNDGVTFKLNENEVVNDNYSIFMDPCSPRLKELGVKYFLFTDNPEQIETRCMSPIKKPSGFHIYRRNDF